VEARTGAAETAAAEPDLEPEPELSGI
jgi:hypothetical protein